MNWYFRKDGIEKGPITSQQLRALARKGVITAEDQVRREDLAEWLLATSVKGLVPEVLTATNWQLTKGVLGGHRIKLGCPHCQESLVVDLDMAGQQDACPQCTRAFMVPIEPAEDLKRQHQDEQVNRRAKQAAVEQASAHQAIVEVIDAPQMVET